MPPVPHQQRQIQDIFSGVVVAALLAVLAFSWCGDDRAPSKSCESSLSACKTAMVDLERNKREMEKERAVMQQRIAHLEGRIEKYIEARIDDGISQKRDLHVIPPPGSEIECDWPLVAGTACGFLVVGPLPTLGVNLEWSPSNPEERRVKGGNLTINYLRGGQRQVNFSLVNPAVSGLAGLSAKIPIIVSNTKTGEEYDYSVVLTKRKIATVSVPAMTAADTIDGGAEAAMEVSFNSSVTGGEVMALLPFVLKSKPSRRVVVAFDPASPSVAAKFRVTPNELTFTTSNYKTTQHMSIETVDLKGLQSDPAGPLLGQLQLKSDDPSFNRSISVTGLGIPTPGFWSSIASFIPF